MMRPEPARTMHCRTQRLVSAPNSPYCCDGACDTRRSCIRHTQELEGSVPSSKDVSADVSTQLASSEMQEAASIVSQHVNSLACRVQHELMPEDRSVLSLLVAALAYCHDTGAGVTMSQLAA